MLKYFYICSNENFIFIFSCLEDLTSIYLGNLFFLAINLVTFQLIIKLTFILQVSNIMSWPTLELKLKRLSLPNRLESQKNTYFRKLNFRVQEICIQIWQPNPTTFRIAFWKEHNSNFGQSNIGKIPAFFVSIHKISKIIFIFLF